MASAKGKRGRISYDRKAGRFRDANGRFIPRARALKSSHARTQFQYAQGTLGAPRRRKKAPAPTAAPPAKPAAQPPKKLPKYRESAATVQGQVVEGQRLFSGVGKWSVSNVAALLLKLIRKGYTSFRLWYKLKDIGFGSEGQIMKGSHIGSTTEMLANVLTKNDDWQEIADFLQRTIYGRTGRVIYFWASKRSY